MSLMERFANPETVHSLTISEKLAGAGITTLMGMGTTFVVLILLWGCIVIMNKVMKQIDKKAEPLAKADKVEKSKDQGQSVIKTSEAGLSVTIDTKGDNPSEEVIAAIIGAAVTAYNSGTGVTKPEITVRRIERSSGFSPAWAVAGRSESIDSRRM